MLVLYSTRDMRGVWYQVYLQMLWSLGELLSEVHGSQGFGAYAFSSSERMDGMVCRMLEAPHTLAVEQQ